MKFNERNHESEKQARQIMAEACQIWNAGDLSDEVDLWFVEPDDVAITSDTMADFAAGPWGRGKHTQKVEHGGIQLFVRDEVQVAKGLRRGTMYLADFGAFRCAYFDGETA